MSGHKRRAARRAGQERARAAKEPMRVLRDGEAVPEGMVTAYQWLLNLSYDTSATADNARAKGDHDSCVERSVRAAAWALSAAALTTEGPRLVTATALAAIQMNNATLHAEAKLLGMRALLYEQIHGAPVMHDMQRAILRNIVAYPEPEATDEHMLGLFWSMITKGHERWLAVPEEPGAEDKMRGIATIIGAFCGAVAGVAENPGSARAGLVGAAWALAIGLQSMQAISTAFSIRAQQVEGIVPAIDVKLLTHLMGEHPGELLASMGIAFEGEEKGEAPPAAAAAPVAPLTHDVIADAWQARFTSPGGSA